MEAFLIMPFKKEFNNVRSAIERACDRYAEESKAILKDHPRPEEFKTISCVRMDEVEGTYPIVPTLLERIRRATLCIVDITGNNANVMWELGFAMALEKPVIILTQNRGETPFDLSNYRNIEYDQDDLDESLEAQLVRELKQLVLTLTDLSVTPIQTLHARALAMSSASPTYFLSEDYKINYMNEAAALIFESAGGGRDWRGRPLREFMNEFAHRLLNQPAIEKNLQVQNEEIQKFVRAKNPSAITPYNIEPIVLKTEKYGILELQKTGVAVRDPSNDSIVGWVVSFNVVRPEQPEEYADFHESHKTIIEGRLFWHDRASPNIVSSPSPNGLWQPGAKLEEWISSGCEGAKLTQSRNYADKQIAFEFAAEIMKTARYGLRSVKDLEEWFFDFENSEFLTMFAETGELIGVFRLHPNHNVLQYQNLESWILDAARDNQTFADVGAYLHPAIEAPEQRRNLLAAMVGYAASIGEQVHNQLYLYAQVPSRQIRLFKRFGFIKAGSTFKCEGWEQQWIPVSLKCIVLDRDSLEFEAWNKRRRAEDNLPEDADLRTDPDFVSIASDYYKLAGSPSW